jgi:hypothetical protein
MTPTGNTTADMIFTGLMLVLNLAALAGLGYLLGRLMGDRRAKTADAAATWWERHAGDAMRRARLAEDQIAAAKANQRAMDTLLREWLGRPRRYGGHHPPGDQLIPQTLAILERCAKESGRQPYTPTEDTGEPD